jgi:hypothetical protein
MRDDRHLWTPPARLTDPLDLGGVTLMQVDVGRQVMISGGAIGRDGVGWPDVALGDVYRVALRRDRVVEVGGAERTDGWDAKAGEAVSDISDGFEVFEMSGPNALDVLQRGTEITTDQASASVARVLFGLGVWVYRHGNENTFRLHVARAQSEALKGYLTEAGKQASRVSGLA